MNQFANDLKAELQKIIKEKYVDNYDLKPEILIPESSKGDYSTNYALQAFKTVKNSLPSSRSRLQAVRAGSPIELANKLKEDLINGPLKEKIGKIHVVEPGFLNIFISESFLGTQIDYLLNDEKKVDLATKSQKVMVEFGDPNPFKEIHIGHLRNLTVGESFARLLEYQGYEVARANYQGDVGMHVAKAIWGMIQNKAELDSLKSLPEKVKFLAKSYAEGAQAFEEDEAKKAEIVEINKKVYSGDPEIKKLWEMGRKWSLDSFEEVYRLLGVSYDYYYFESQTAPEGKKIVESSLESGVFEKDGGAVILKGEKSGLHTRVFITGDGNPTYEAKDLALAVMKHKDFSYDLSYIITANEQIDYFKVVLKALSLLEPKIAEKNFHYSFGFVSLKDGKMSSRTGNVVGANWLIDETKKRLEEKFPKVDNENLTKIAVGAVKYSMLKFGRESDIKFSFEESINIKGNSGPYIQYTFARTQSIMLKTAKKGQKKFSQSNLATEMLAVARALCHFEDAVFHAAENFSPNILANYLYDLSNKFNLFYEKHKVIGGENEESKLALVDATGRVLKKGLYLLGIDAPEKI